MRNQVTKAEMSSALNLRNDLIESHLKRIKVRCQNPLATLRKSSRVGR